MHIAIIGAFDRMNYGDLLFPIVLTEYFLRRYGPSVAIDYYGHRSSDLTAFGGFKTKPMRKLFCPKELPEGSVIIIAGGEVLSATWIDTMFYLAGKKPWWQRLAHRLAGPRAEIILIRRYLGCRNHFPYLFSKADFSIPPAIIYNAVGGSSLVRRNKDFKRSVALVLRDADYLSVRDQASIEILKNAGVDLAALKMAPDCAAVLPNLFPISLVESKLSDEAMYIRTRLSEKPFITFQIGKVFVQDSVGIIADQLNMLTKKTGFDIILLPIGRASGHEDQTVLSQILHLLYKPAILPLQNTVFDTIWFIADSQLFIGTSLHGAITAMAYCVPHISLTKAVDGKIAAFLETWDLNVQNDCVNFTEIYNSALNRLQIPKKQLIEFQNNFVSNAEIALNHMANTLEEKMKL